MIFTECDFILPTLEWAIINQYYINKLILLSFNIVSLQTNNSLLSRVNSIHDLAFLKPNIHVMGIMLIH